MPGEHPVHDAVTKTYRHLNFFQHGGLPQVRTPRVKLPDGLLQLVKPALQRARRGRWARCQGHRHERC
jgi:hypothetical protein